MQKSSLISDFANSQTRFRAIVVKFLVFIITILIYQRNILVIANILQDTSLLYRYNSFVMLGAYKTLYRKEAYYESAK